MIRLIRGEFAKLFTTKLWLWLLLGAVAMTGLFVSLTIGFADQANTQGAPPLTSAAGQRNIFAAASLASVWSLILGIIAVTGEFRHQTVTPTFLATPHRGRVVIGKLVAYALTGIGYGVVTVALAIAITVPWLSAKNVGFSLGANGIPGTMVGVLASAAVYALLGVGLGALIRNQIAAVVGALVYLFVVEGFAANLPKVRDYYRYLPGGANSALTSNFQGPNTPLLEPYQGGLLLVGYGLAFAILGAWLAVRRDVT
jgi:ABC-type transport system involved in multi-copper enzyme maturation permease subunit